MGDEVFYIHFSVMLPHVDTYICVCVVVIVAFVGGGRRDGSILVRNQREVDYSVFNAA